MSWEIKGTLEDAADVDAVFAEPTEAPSDAEAGQVAAVKAAVLKLVDAGVVRPGPLTIRAGGNANEGDGWIEGQPCEQVTLTLEYVVPAAEPAPEPVVPPTWGDARTNTDEEVAAAEGRTIEPDAAAPAGE